MRALLTLFVMVWAWQAQAHQQKQAITSVMFNSRTEMVEISHRFYVHDAEHAVKRIVDKKADLLHSKVSQLRFAEYVAQHFFLRDDKSKTFDLRLIGFEVEGKFFWVYQEFPTAKTVKKIHVKHTSLQDIWPRQTNIVNIEKRGTVRSLQFDASDEWKTADVSQ